MGGPSHAHAVRAAAHLQIRRTQSQPGSLRAFRLSIPCRDEGAGGDSPGLSPCTSPHRGAHPAEDLRKHAAKRVRNPPSPTPISLRLTSTSVRACAAWPPRSGRGSRTAALQTRQSAAAATPAKPPQPPVCPPAADAAYASGLGRRRGSAAPSSTRLTGRSSTSVCNSLLHTPRASTLTASHPPVRGRFREGLLDHWQQL